MAISFLSDGYFPDNAKLTFGDATTPDLEIYHDGSHSRIADVGTGHLVINATDFVINNSADSANLLQAIDGGAVNLYFNGSQVFRTVSTGIDVTGTWNGLVITGSGTSHTQGAIVLKSSTTDTPEARGQGVFMFNEGDDSTWYTGTQYQDADTWMVGRKAGATIDTSAATNAQAFLKIANAGNMTFSTYGSGTFTGTSAYYIIADSSGNLIEKTPAEVRADIGAGTGAGNTTSSGTANKVAKFDGTNSIVDSIITDDGSDISVAGDVLIPAGYVGRDSQNRVDFSTDNQIIFRVADTHRAKMDSDGFLPYADSAYDLGTSSLYWKDAYIDTITTTGDISVGGGLLFASDDGATCTPVNWLSFLCPDTGTSVNSKIGYLQTNFPDNSKVTFGNATNGDMQIWHKSTGSINRIDSGAIPIKIQSYGDVTIGDSEIYNNYSGLFKIDQTLSRAGVYGSEEAMWTFYADSSNRFTALDDGNIRLVTSATGITITGGFTSSASSSCAGLNMTADIAMAGNNITLDTDGNIELDPSLSAGQSSGTILKFGSGLLTAGDVYYAYSSMGSTQWSTVNHTSANTTKLLAVAIGTSATTNGMLLNGILYKSMHGFTVGLPLYLASSNGDFTTTVPTTSNYYARVLGYAIDSNHIYFCPDNTWVEID